MWSGVHEVCGPSFPGSMRFGVHVYLGSMLVGIDLAAGPLFWLVFFANGLVSFLPILKSGSFFSFALLILWCRLVQEGGVKICCASPCLSVVVWTLQMCVYLKKEGREAKLIGCLFVHYFWRSFCFLLFLGWFLFYFFSMKYECLIKVVLCLKYFICKLICCHFYSLRCQLFEMKFLFLVLKFLLTQKKKKKNNRKKEIEKN